MKRGTWLPKLLAAAMAFALLGAACAQDEGSGGDAATQVEEQESTSPESAEDSMTENDLQTETADLVQALTYGLEEHEYLAGIAVTMGVQKGLDSGEFKAAAQALDENSVDLADVIGSVYGDEARDQFLDLWRKHIGFFVDYTKGRATGDKQLVKKAEKNLDGYRADFGAFIEGATEGALTKDQVAEALSVHVQSTFDAIDAVAGVKDGNPFSLLKKAAGHLPMTATALATGIATQQGLN